MKPTPRFTCQSGGLLAPCDLVRPRRRSRPRPLGLADLAIVVDVDVDDVDQGWSAWGRSLSGRSAA